MHRQSAALALAAACSLAAAPARAVDLIGYVPSYRLNSNYLNNVLPTQLSMLDEVRYFGFSVSGTGAITTLDGSVSTHKNNVALIRSKIDSLPVDQRPRLNITLGGAGVDATFTTVAASAVLRDTLAVNINALLNETGAVSVDLDWEHPDAGVQRSTHYPALLKRVKQEVGAERRVYATVDPTVMVPSSVFAAPNGIDGVSLMTYDLGWWGNDPGNPLRGEHSVHAYVEDAIEAWTEPPGSPNDRPWVFGTWGNNAPEERLGVGLPFYGRDVVGGNAYTFSQLHAVGATTDDEYYSFNGQNVWIPGPTTIEQRVQLAHDSGLQHLIIWELGQDLPASNADSMLRIAYQKKLAVNVPEPSAGALVMFGALLAVGRLVYRRN